MLRVDRLAPRVAVRAQVHRAADAASLELALELLAAPVASGGLDPDLHLASHGCGGGGNRPSVQSRRPQHTPEILDTNPAEGRAAETLRLKPCGLSRRA
eukprot:6893984-Alexandrium_andersonii.AAC.1